MSTPVAIITGASSGIGEATARLFARHGYATVLVARSEERLTAIAEQIRQDGGEALALAADVTDRAAVRSLVQKTVARYGRIDVLVNNAGRGFSGTVAAIDPADLEALLRLNVVAPIICLQAVVPQMRHRGGGVIVNVSSMVEKMPLPFNGPYAASKIALSYLSDAARIELSRDHIAVVNVLPGFTRTAFGANVLTAPLDPSIDLTSMNNAIPQGVSPEVVAETIWRAVHTHPRQVIVGAMNRVGAAFMHLGGGSLNGLLTWAVNRYVPRPGETGRRPADDLRMASGVGVAAATVLAGGLLVRRRATHG